MDDPANSEEGLFSITPNPVGEILHLAIQENLKGELLIEVFSPDGRMLLQDQKFNYPGEVNIPVQHLPAGLYFVKFISGNYFDLQFFLKN